MLPKVRNCGANLWISDVIMLQCSSGVRDTCGKTISSQSWFGAVVALSIISNRLVWWIHLYPLAVFWKQLAIRFSHKAKLSQGMKSLAFPITCLKRFLSCKQGTIIGRNKNRVNRVLLPLYNSTPKQCIVSAGQLVFVSDKKPAVQNLFCKNAFQHCQWFPSKESHFFLSLLTNSSEAAVWKSRIKYAVLSRERMLEHRSRKGVLIIKRSGFTIDSSTYLKHKAERALTVQEVVVGWEVDCWKRKWRLRDTQGLDMTRRGKRPERREEAPEDIWLYCCFKLEYFLQWQVL